MTEERNTLTGETLDPTDWGSMRALSHRMLGDNLDHLQMLWEHPAWQNAPRWVKEPLSGPRPAGPQAPQAVHEEGPHG